MAFSIQAPEAPSTIELTPGYFQITVTPHQTVYDASVQYEFWYSATQLATAADIQSKAQYLGTGSFWLKVNIKPGHDAWFYVRSVNLVGKSTFAEAKGQSSDDAEGLLDILSGKITDTELGKELLEKIDSGGGANAKIDEISKSWTDAEGKLNALRMTKIGVLQDGRYYLAGIGMGIENTPDGMQSQILMAAQQLAIVDPTNGNTTPMFVARDGQIIMNEAFMKYLNVNGRFIVTPDGEVTMRTYPGRNVGQVITS
ncbi:host specificity protein J, partial [Salmonella enterica subsp. enterica serovar Florida]|nr:host specificity protein J [Salmonella enterica subsp. enterica serovar Florida]